MEGHANKNNVAPPMIDPVDAIIFAAPDSVGASVDSVAPGISVGAEESVAGASVGEESVGASVGAVVGSEVSKAELQSREGGHVCRNGSTFVVDNDTLEKIICFFLALRASRCDRTETSLDIGTRSNI
jgi:hypothetical protein